MSLASSLEGLAVDRTFRPVSRDAAAAFAIAVAAALLPFHRAFHFPFALDDYTFLLQAAGLDPAPFLLRRWLSVRGYYELMLHLFGPRPEMWHVLAFLLH